MGMRKIEFYIRNAYKLMVSKPNGRKEIMYYQEAEGSKEDNLLSETFLKQVITADDPCLIVDEEMQNLLADRVAKKGPSSSPVCNSLLNLFLPVFSLKHIELKMAVISVALVITLGLGPTYNHSVNRSFNPFFLADTLNDTSILNMPFRDDSVLKVQYK
jgi:hypothetical protein